MIKLPKSIRENLHFLCVEVDVQVAGLQRCFKTPTAALARRVLDRAGYADNLKSRIHHSVTAQLRSGAGSGERELALRCVEFLATDLQQMTQICRNCINQLEAIEQFHVLGTKGCQSMLKPVRKGISRLEEALAADDSRVAIRIGRINRRVERGYQKQLKRYTRALKQHPKRSEDLTRALFVAYELRQLGEILRHMSEAIISANLGQPISFERFFSLRALVAELGADAAELQISPLAQTRSGSAISGISSRRSEGNGYLAIFKDGEKRKVKEERAGVNSWHRIYPGLAPRILSYEKGAHSAALLIEHLPGYTLEQILLNESDALLQEAQQRLSATLESIWKETRNDRQIRAGFMRQLRKRLPEVYRIHPEFSQSDSRICGLKVASFDTLVSRVQALESDWPAPFSVYIHGDFNVDNIIYDPREKRINFIDLHRSRYMDYVQDVSVFMVSNYRLQILETHTRQRLMRAAQALYLTAQRHARKGGDDTFELRLALGLARSFATSTRFILDKSLARRMMLRARYLLELVLAIKPGRETTFRLPVKEIFFD